MADGYRHADHCRPVARTDCRVMLEAILIDGWHTTAACMTDMIKRNMFSVD